MRISANRDDLLKPLQQIVGVVERRQTLPILANVLIAVKENQLSLTATDLEVELRTSTLVQCKGELEFTLPARKLLDICKALPESADINLDVEGDKAVLRSGRGRYTLGMLPAQDYPSIELSKPSETVSVPVEAIEGWAQAAATSTIAALRRLDATLRRGACLSVKVTSGLKPAGCYTRV